MNNRLDRIALLLLSLVTALALLQSILFLPVIAHLIAGLGVALSVPGQVAVSAGRYGPGFTLAIFVGAIIAGFRIDKADLARRAVNYAVAAIILVIVLLLQFPLYVDFAQVAGRLAAGGK